MAQHDRPLILITGNSGLIGEKIVADLARDHRIVGLDVKKPESMPDGSDFVKTDLTDDASVRKALGTVRERHGSRLASVIHLAAYYDFSGAPSDLYDKLTVEGTRRLLRELQRFECGQFVFSSTLLVMKPAEPGDTIDEGSDLQAEWDYPRSKIQAEKVIASERGDIPAVVLRLAGAYDEGGHSPPLTQQIARINEKKLESHFFPGNQDHGQPFVHLDDTVLAFRRAVEKRDQLAGFQVFLIAEPDAMSYGELQDAIGEALHGTDWTTIRIPAPAAKAGAFVKDKLSGGEEFIKPWMVDLADAHYPVSVDKARKVLGWNPAHRLRDTLPQMIRGLRADPEGWYRENGLSNDSDD